MDSRAYFGQELRRLREDAKLTREQMARSLGYSWETIRSIEMGRRTPKAQIAEKADEFFNLRGVLVGLQRKAATETSQFGELREHEQRASEIRIYDLRVVPGLMQTAAYATAILGDPELVRERIERQKIFAREHPPFMRVILSEATLYTFVGHPSIQREQLRFLARADAPWELQVIPLCHGLHSCSAGPIILLSFADDDPVAFLDSLTGGTLVDDSGQVSTLAKQYEALTAEALPPVISREMINAIADDPWEDEHNAGLA